MVYIRIAGCGRSVLRKSLSVSHGCLARTRTAIGLVGES